MLISVRELKKVSDESFYVVRNGKLLTEWSALKDEELVEVRFRLCGGKGGFGSLLRSFGSQFYKSTNQDMCRDLTGRRLRDIKEEKRLQNYIEKAHVRKQEKQNKLESKYRKLLDPPKPDFDDAEYAQKKQKIMDETEHALEEGLRRLKDRSSEPGCSATVLPLDRKRKNRENSTEEPDLKRGTLWLGIEGINDSSDSDEGESSDSECLHTENPG